MYTEKFLVMKKRLFAGFSLANAINIISIMKTLPNENWENYYVYLGPAENLKIVCELLYSNTTINRFFNLSTNNIVFSLSMQKLNEVVKIKDFDELYLQFNGADYRTITRKYSKASIYLIEDGLSSYEKHDLTFLLNKKPKAIYTHNYLQGFFPHECRYSNLNHIQIDVSETKEIYQNLSKNIVCPYDPNTVLFCGQELYSTDIITYQNELRLYVDAINNLVQKGIQVKFKEHPRNTKPFYPHIKKIINSVLLSEFPKTKQPIELFIAKQRPKAIVSPFSTSIFLASHIFNVPAYTVNFLQYKTQNLVLRIYDYAAVIAQALFKYSNDLTAENINYKISYNKEIETLLWIKELEFYRMFVSRKNFYKMKKDFLTYCKDINLLKKFNIHPVVINIIKNGKYIDLLKCNKLNIRHNSKEYFKQFKTIKTLSELIFVLSEGMRNILKAIF